MDYIINPWWFYLIGVVNSLGFVVKIICVLLGLPWICSFAVYVLNAFDPDEETSPDGKEAFKMTTIIFIPILLLAIFVPSKDTMNKMLIADTLTKQNIEAGADFTQDQIAKVIDKITEAAKEAKKDRSNLIL